MSKPGIENGKRKLPWKTIAGVGVVGAGLLALSQCGGGDEQPSVPGAPTPTETPASPPANGNWNPDSYIYRYEIKENMPLHESASADSKSYIFLKAGSCVESRPDASGKASRSNGFAEVNATSVNGVDASEGWIELKKVGDLGGYKIGGRRPDTVCTAQFITAVTGPENKSVPAQLFLVSNSANFYATADETSAPAGIAGDGSCVKSTGIERGNMMQVQVNDKAYWAVKENFRPAPSHVTPDACQAKFEPSL